MVEEDFKNDCSLQNVIGRTGVSYIGGGGAGGNTDISNTDIKSSLDNDLVMYNKFTSCIR